MKYREYFKELFDAPETNVAVVPGDKEGGYKKELEFKIGDEDIFVGFYTHYYNSVTSEWKQKYGIKPPYTKKEIEFYKIDNHGRSVLDIDKSPNYIKIFATVIDIVRKNIKDTDVIVFSSKSEEPSRVKLYDRFVKKFFGDYILEKFSNANHVHYTLIPKKIINTQ
jgi:hypothetical protein